MWEIALIIAAVVFSITCFFVIRTLLNLDKTLSDLKVKVDHLSDEGLTALRQTEARLALFDSTFRSLANLGDIFETKTSQMRANLVEKQSLARDETPHLGEDIVQWALISANLYQQFFNKRNKHGRQ